MASESLAAALEREHHEIDAGIAAFTAGPQDPRPLLRAIQALRRHIYLEEEFLFPLLYGAEPGLKAPIAVMLHEHAQIWTVLDALESEPSAGPTRHLVAQLLHHNMKEERVLYPRADHVLPTAATERLQAFLDSGAMPDGWVCLKAHPTVS